MADDAGLRRYALQLAAQLPTEIADAEKVIDYLRELTEFLRQSPSDHRPLVRLVADEVSKDRPS